MGVGVASGCGCKEVYRFPHTPYPYSSCICYFFSSILLFVHLKMFFVLVPVLFSNLCNNFFAQYKHIRATTGVPRQPYEGLHIMFYTRRSTHKRTLHILRWTSAVCLQGAGCRSRSRGRALYRDASRATIVLGPPPSRGGDLELEGGVNCVLVKIWRSTWKTYLVWCLNVVVR